jgi:hypothetical protein
MPTDMESLRKVLTAFRDRDPNANGKNDEIPMLFLGPWELKFFSHAWGVAANDYNIYLDDAGKVQYWPQDDRFFDMIETLRGFYADRKVTPQMFVMYDSLSGESDAIAQANLPEIFAALSDGTTLRAALKIYEIPYYRMYDAESLADVLTVPETEIAKVTEALKTLGQLAESTIPYNGETVTVYTRVSKQNVRMLLSLTRLLYRCGTDGNM